MAILTCGKARADCDYNRSKTEIGSEIFLGKCRINEYVRQQALPPHSRRIHDNRDVACCEVRADFSSVMH